MHAQRQDGPSQNPQTNSDLNLLHQRETLSATGGNLQARAFPGENATLQIAHIRDAHGAQLLQRLFPALASATHDNDLRISIDLARALFKLIQRDQLRARNPFLTVLDRLPNVDQATTRRQEIFEFMGRNG